LSESERAALIRQSPLAGRYDKPLDRESAYELLGARAAQASVEAAARQQTTAGPAGGIGDMLGDLAGQVMKSAVRQAANQFGRQLVRGLLGSLLGGKGR
jgi:hypothetical protein